MSYIDLTITSAPPTPATNHVEVYVSSSDKHLSTIDDSGTIRDFGGGTVTSSTAGNLALFPSTGSMVSDTYVQNSYNITIGIASQGSRSSNLALTIPNPGNSVTLDTFALLGTTQTFSGVNTFSGGAGALTMSSSTIAMGSNKITGLANGTASSDAAAFGQIYTGFQSLVQATKTTAFTTTSNSFTNVTGLSASVTPTSSSHRIKITASGMFKNGALGNALGCITLQNGTTNLGSTFGFASLGTDNASTLAFKTPFSISYIDSPASTSAQTYNVAIRNNDNATTVGINTDGTLTSVIILEEIV